MARNRERARERKERLHRDNVPGQLDHVSGEVDEANAAVVAGAGGQTYDADDSELEREALRAAADRGAGGGDGGAGPPAIPGGGGDGAAPAKKRPLPRLLQFFRACWAELQRVQWPDRVQVGQATAVVLGFVVVAGAFLGAMDEVSQKIVDAIL
jgi:preprotein translocase subunit SecE